MYSIFILAHFLLLIQVECLFKFVNKYKCRHMSCTIPVDFKVASIVELQRQKGNVNGDEIKLEAVQSVSEKFCIPEAELISEIQLKSIDMENDV